MQVVASAIVDKYIGESARIIREMFNYAREHQPCIIFMDEIDAIGGKRFSEGTSADREIQRTLMELLAQLDGFDQLGKVRPPAATARGGAPCCPLPSPCVLVLPSSWDSFGAPTLRPVAARGLDGSGCLSGDRPFPRGRVGGEARVRAPTVP